MRRPEFIARQGRMPSGVFGNIVASVMQRETEDVNQSVIELLDISRGERILDIGCGNGMSLSGLATKSGDGLIVGVDHSDLMCRRAVANNRQLITDGRVKVECAASDDLPFESGLFDAVMSVHTIYFWSPAKPHLDEIARVLRPGGQILLAFRTSADSATANFPESVYKFRSASEVADRVSDSNFENVRISGGLDTATFLCATKC
jgi:ubiquinone/menaquinone biosynthesis C-methylase UbiE